MIVRISEDTVLPTDLMLFLSKFTFNWNLQKKLHSKIGFFKKNKKDKSGNTVRDSLLHNFPCRLSHE